ncbi:hypothetical protein GGF31_006800 [Allomyces arbusculus]|nr:hypothetical protein GGF31_006800 [Allomyces arbusculus]
MDAHVYRITHPETFQRKTDLTLDDVMATSIFAEDAEQEVVLRDDLDSMIDLVSERQLEQLQNNAVPWTSGFTETVSWLLQRFNHVLDPSKGKIFPALDLTSRDIVGSVTVTDDPYTSEDKRSAIRHEMVAFVAKFPESIEDLDQQPCNWVQSPIGYHVDLEQHWCAVCRETHANPQCAFNVVENGKMYISCFQRRYIVFPEDAQPCMSELKRNVLYFNANVSIQQTIVNNYASVDEVDFAFDKIQFTDDPTLDDLLYDALTTPTYSIARWYLARERFNYVSQGVWYEFKDHYWVEDRVQSLIVFLSTVVAPFFRLVKELGD